MLKIIVFGILITSISACSDSQDAAKNVTKNAIKISKEVLGGVSKGIDEGRKEVEGVDGAIIVTNIDELEQNIIVELLKVTSLFEGQKTEIEIGFKNSIDKPIRIANLDDKATILILDTDGYAQELDISSRRGTEITVPAKAGIKHSLLFNIPISKAKTLRLWNKEYPIKDIPILKDSNNGNESI